MKVIKIPYISAGSNRRAFPRAPCKKKTFILSESAVGYALFEQVQFEGVALDLEEVQESILDYERFSKAVKLLSFCPFDTAAKALENMNDVSEGVLNGTLRDFLDLTFAKGRKTALLGVSDTNLGSCIKAQMKIECVHDEKIRELSRGIRLNYNKLVGQINSEDADKARLGLGHAYSRAKVKFSVNRIDNMIIQSISLIDQMDKDINKLYMRVREWYGWAFPELAKVLTETEAYLKVVKHLCDNAGVLKSGEIDWIVNLGIDREAALGVIDASKMSMGADISVSDAKSINSLVTIVLGMIDYRKRLSDYLSDRMEAIAPNLKALVGDVVGARLIAHSGSLTNLSKCPASTVQIIGAEKALFRALKTRGRTPKYGLIYNSSFVSSSTPKNKGRVSRMLANKCSLASRIDCFFDEPTSIFGEKLREQILERMKFYETGDLPRKSADVMREALAQISVDNEEMQGEIEPKKKRRKRKLAEEEDTESNKVVHKKKKTDVSNKKDPSKSKREVVDEGSRGGAGRSKKGVICERSRKKGQSSETIEKKKSKNSR